MKPVQPYLNIEHTGTETAVHIFYKQNMNMLYLNMYLEHINICKHVEFKF